MTQTVNSHRRPVPQALTTDRNSRTAVDSEGSIKTGTRVLPADKYCSRKLTFEGGSISFNRFLFANRSKYRRFEDREA